MLEFLDFLAPTLLVLVVVVLLLRQIVSAVGKTKLADQVWNFYTAMASKAGHSKFGEISQLKSQLRAINAERRSISSQDEYARWTKLNRQFDKLTTEVDTLVEQTATERSQLVATVNLAITIFTVAPVWLLRLWYRKTVFFYFPKDALPHSVEWVLAFPFTLTGGVGLTVWMFAVGLVLSAISFAVSFLMEKPVEKPERENPKAKAREDIKEKTEKVL